METQEREGKQLGFHLADRGQGKRKELLENEKEDRRRIDSLRPVCKISGRKQLWVFKNKIKYKIKGWGQLKDCAAVQLRFPNVSTVKLDRTKGPSCPARTVTGVQQNTPRWKSSFMFRDCFKS